MAAIRGVVNAVRFDAARTVESPVAGATVRLNGRNGAWSTKTDKYGRYAFWNVFPGRYDITAYKRGYLFDPWYGDYAYCARAGELSNLTLDVLDYPASHIDWAGGWMEFRERELHGFNPGQTSDLYSIGEC